MRKILLSNLTVSSFLFFPSPFSSLIMWDISTHDVYFHGCRNQSALEAVNSFSLFVLLYVCMYYIHTYCMYVRVGYSSQKGVVIIQTWTLQKPSFWNSTDVCQQKLCLLDGELVSQMSLRWNIHPWDPRDPIPAHIAYFPTSCLCNPCFSKFSL